MILLGIVLSILAGCSLKCGQSLLSIVRASLSCGNMAEITAMIHHGLAAFYGAHSVGTDVLLTSVGTTLAVRTVVDGISYLTRPIVARAGNCYHGSKRWIKDPLVIPDKCLTGPAYLCCLEGFVARKLQERRRTVVPAPSLDSRARVTGKPVWSDEAGCFVMYKHPSAPPLKLRPVTVTSNGDITYDVVPAHVVSKSTDGDEKRVKKVEPANDWTIEYIFPLSMPTSSLLLMISLMALAGDHTPTNSLPRSTWDL